MLLCNFPAATEKKVNVVFCPGLKYIATSAGLLIIPRKEQETTVWFSIVISKLLCLTLITRGSALGII